MSLNNAKSRRIASGDLAQIIDEHITAGHAFTLLVKGNSMRPFYTHNQTRVTLVAPLPLKRGDVCLFTYRDKVFLHRLINQQNDTYTFQGDALIAKETVSLDAIIAKVSHYNHHGKTIDATAHYHRLKVRLWRLCRPFYHRLKRRRVKR